jgi:putative mycofactocin binding protein MftB
MRSQAVWKLAEGVQVRRERFGLLFYSSWGPRLYFLSSKDLIEESFFEGKETVRGLVESIHKKYGFSVFSIQEKVSQILESLQTKGLINEQ